MSALDNLKAIQELDKFNKIKDYIKSFILTSENLWKIIYYPTSNPLDYNYGENPYIIFDEIDSNEKHGVVLFKDKNDVILNSEMVNILITFSSEALQDSNCISTVFITFDVILKGINIQLLTDTSSRAYKICELIDEQFNHKKIDKIGKIKRILSEKTNLNEENSGFKLTYKCISTNYTDEIQIYTYQHNEDAWGITRDSYTLFSSTEPILADIRPYTSDDKNVTTYGYDTNITRRMFCDIIPEIIESIIIKYDNQYYKIQKFTQFDDYLDCELVVIWKKVLIE